MEQDLALIDEYLHGNLSPEERVKVDRRIKQDPVFANRVRIIRDSEIAMSHDIEGFKNDLKEIDSNFRSIKSQSDLVLNKSSYLLAAAATIISLVFAGYLIWFQNPTPDRLYAVNFQIPAENITVRAGGMDDTLSAALQAYQEADYGQAVLLFEQVLKTKPDYQGVIFYAGICYLSVDKDQEARDKFQKVLALEPKEYHSAARWYLGLTFLKIDELEHAKDVLQQLYESKSGNYSKDAGRLLDAI